MEDLQKRIDDTLNELSEVSVTLDSDPLEYGPERITLKFANLDKHSQRLTQIELQLVQDIHKLKRSYDEDKLIYDAKKFKLMATDTRVKAEKTKSEREAAADRMLEKDVSELRKMENNTTDLEIVLLVVQTKRKDIRDTESRLRNQMKMVQESIRAGGKWKNSTPPVQEAGPKDLTVETSGLSIEEEEAELEDFYNS